MPGKKGASALTPPAPAPSMPRYTRPGFPYFDMQSFRKPVHADFEAVNQRIIEQLHSDVGLVKQIGHYLIAAGGKRLRPLLVLIAARCCGYNGQRHIDLAVIIEFIHTATLLHDDVVDTSEQRRGRYTANAQWGNAPSILVGDFLYSRVFQMMVALGNMAIMDVLAETTNIISEGEVRQLINIGDAELSEAEYLAVIGGKTAQLFKGAAHTAALLSGADPATCTALSNYGWQLGLAFQLVDDALDYTSDSAELGKNTGDDLAEGKMTLPLIQAMKHASESQQRQLRKAISQKDASMLRTVVDIVRDTRALDYTLQQARACVRKAQDSLEQVPSSEFRTALIALADFAVTRNH